MTIPILYEDKDILAINKPSGLMVHSDGRTKEKTLVDWIVKKYPKSKNVGEPQGDIIRSGIVHRLDRETSGVLLIAKTKKGFECLKKQFQNREVKKTYNAFVYGILKEDEGTINRPIARSRSDFRLWSAQRGSRGEAREAVTNYKVLNRKKEVGESGATYIEVKPLTGRTHQIRVHMKAINHPVIGDKLYAPLMPRGILGFERLALHARMIMFTNCQGASLVVGAKLPKDFEFALSKF